MTLQFKKKHWPPPFSSSNKTGRFLLIGPVLYGTQMPVPRRTRCRGVRVRGRGLLLTLCCSLISLLIRFGLYGQMGDCVYLLKLFWRLSYQGKWKLFFVFNFGFRSLSRNLIIFLIVELSLCPNHVLLGNKRKRDYRFFFVDLAYDFLSDDCGK